VPGVRRSTDPRHPAPGSAGRRGYIELVPDSRPRPAIGWTEPVRPRGPGRPRSATPREIEQAAFQLFLAQGYEATTMEEIAAAAGIGRTTLFRNFPAKSDILWDPYADYARRLDAALRATPDGLPLVDAVFDGYRAAIDADPVEVARMKVRLRLIAELPSSTTAMWEHFDYWVVLLCDFLADRLGAARDSHEVLARARLIWIAIWTAMTIWALSDDLTPERHLDDARAMLSDF